MIKEIYLSSAEDAFRQVSYCPYDDTIHRYRSQFLYRGMPDASFRLTTSLWRNCGEKQFLLEGSILRNFTKYAADEDSHISDSVWRQMILGQHHGLPTRLMDWTFSPLVTLHFCTTSVSLDELDAADAVIWRIDSNELKEMLPEDYKAVLRREKADLFTIDMMKEIAPTTTDYDRAMGSECMAVLEPPSIDQRIISQYSYFTPVPAGITDVEDFLAEYTRNTVKFIISKDIKWQIRDQLDQMNISERAIMPGLDGLSAWIKRHYYVKSGR